LERLPPRSGFIGALLVGLQTSRRAAALAGSLLLGKKKAPAD
jgi:hypothetical protein